MGRECSMHRDKERDRYEDLDVDERILLSHECDNRWGF
jgi:hypothetical protein